MKINEFIKKQILDDGGDQFAAVEAFEVFLKEVKKDDEGIANYI